MILPGLVVFATLASAVAADSALPPPSAVIVQRLTEAIPADQTSARNFLWNRFANRPEETQFRAYTVDGWEKNWQAFSAALVAKAAEQGLEHEALQKALGEIHADGDSLWNRILALIQGQAEKSSAPSLPKIGLSGTLRDSQAAQANAPKVGLQPQLPLLRKGPGDSNGHPRLPVAAYRAKMGTKELWVILCKWELALKPGEGQRPVIPHLGHVEMFVFDLTSGEPIAYRSCL